VLNKKGLFSFKYEDCRLIMPLLTVEHFFEQRTHFQSQYQQMMVIIMVGKQKMQFNLLNRNFKYLFPNQE